jgi:hypothetical protein
MKSKSAMSRSSPAIDLSLMPGRAFPDKSVEWDRTATKDARASTARSVEIDFPARKCR